ncbi:VPLPA-CTERM sorting domain-containing protein [Thermosulfurimonas dismutans]|uniref:Uncharacterized protein n=1 Tax=Thermosulfurimonas dismutans TaxID=999894 RepID=A0A179D4Z2_9BACT|nr:VPLPA-CTERM sorting domain-containing protein [Thermosulfurimonas dismutans]OAQ20532.1 hypothetical protein TDIS_1301 [Thermosulfurimonas dismutans]
MGGIFLCAFFFFSTRAIGALIPWTGTPYYWTSGSIKASNGATTIFTQSSTSQQAGTLSFSLKDENGDWEASGSLQNDSSGVTFTGYAAAPDLGSPDNAFKSKVSFQFKQEGTFTVLQPGFLDVAFRVNYGGQDSGQTGNYWKETFNLYLYDSQNDLIFSYLGSGSESFITESTGSFMPLKFPLQVGSYSLKVSGSITLEAFGGDEISGNYTVNLGFSPVPLPSAALLLLSGCLGFIGMRLRKKLVAAVAVLLVGILGILPRLWASPVPYFIGSEHYATFKVGYSYKVYSYDSGSTIVGGGDYDTADSNPSSFTHGPPAFLNVSDGEESGYPYTAHLKSDATGLSFNGSVSLDSSYSLRTYNHEDIRLSQEGWFQVEQPSFLSVVYTVKLSGVEDYSSTLNEAIYGFSIELSKHANFDDDGVDLLKKSSTFQVYGVSPEGDYSYIYSKKVLLEPGWLYYLDGSTGFELYAYAGDKISVQGGLFFNVSPVPLPGALWLLGSALFAGGLVARKRWFAH